MGLITKPNTFTGSTAPQLPWLDADLDPVYTEINGNLDDANIKSTANIAQSKILNLVTDIAARLLDTGDTITGELKAKYATPGYRFTGTEASAKDWRIVEDGSDIKFQENTGTEGTPTWTTRYTLPDGAGGPAVNSDLSTKLYVDGLTKSLAFGLAKKTDGDVALGAAFADITGLSVTITTGARRVRITFAGTLNNGGISQASNIGLVVDVDAVVSLAGGFSNSSNSDVGAGFSWVTDVLTAASHTFKIQAKADSAGFSVLRASAGKPALIVVQELPL